MNILCVVAHPDDESFFAGGTLAQHARRGDQVTIVALSDGESSRFVASSCVECQTAIADRKAAFHRARCTLKAFGDRLIVFPDQQSDTVPQLTINRAVEALVVAHNPALVYTHHVGDLNLDHRRVAEAVLVATRGKVPVRCMTPEWPDRCVGPLFDWTLMVHLSTEDIETKVRACQCYGEEMRPYPHPRSEEYIREHVCESFVEIA